jgi:hypothetical protein
MLKELGHKSYIKLVRKHLFLKNMHRNDTIVPLPKKLLPKNQRPENGFSVVLDWQ